MATTLDVQELDRRNLLDMPSSLLRPGARYVLVYKAPADNIAPSDLLAALDRSPDLFGFPPVVQVGRTVTVPVKMRTSPKSTIVEAVVTPIRTVYSQPSQVFVPPLKLTHMVPYEVIVTTTSPARESLGQLAVVAGQSPRQSVDPLGIKSIGKGLGTAAEKVLSTAKWVSFGIIIIVILVVIGQARGAGQALGGR